MRKKFLLLTATFLLSLSVGTSTAQISQKQLSYKDIVNECYKIDCKTGKLYLSGGSENEYNICTVEQVVSLINKDIFGYFKLNQKYKTPLQKNAFKKTEEYTNYLSIFDYDYSCLATSKFYILYNLRYNTAYEIDKKSFIFRIGILDWQRTNQSGYIGLGKNICTTFPADKLNIKKKREYNGELYSYQYIQIPIADEELALKIEGDMSNPYCSTCLLFVVELNKTLSEKHPEFSWAQNNILAKTINLYMVNTKTEQIYCDLSELVGGVKSQIVQSNSISSKIESKVRNKNGKEERREAEARRIEYERQARQIYQSNVGVAQSNVSYEIAGRSAKSLPYPSLKSEFEEGRVVVEVIVNPEGKVVDAKISNKGTTITNSSIRETFLNVALKSVFNKSDTEGNQVGNITYQCRMQ
jgi:hypothetical protein